MPSFPGRAAVIAALGLVQILAWGTSFYIPAVFAEPIVNDTGWSLGFVVGGVSAALLVAGLISPQIGKLIDRHGGRPVLLASSLLYAAGLTLIGLSPNLPVYFAGWSVLGLGMGTGLYDAAFAALGKLYGRDRSKVLVGAQATEEEVKAEALRAAALKLLRSPHNHPAYWAGFVLVGNER